MLNYLEVHKEVQNILHSSSSQERKLRKCRICGGTMFLKCDSHGIFEQCLSCSNSNALHSTADFYDNLEPVEYAKPSDKESTFSESVAQELELIK